MAKTRYRVSSQYAPAHLLSHAGIISPKSPKKSKKKSSGPSAVQQVITTVKKAVEPVVQPIVQQIAPKSKPKHRSRPRARPSVVPPSIPQTAAPSQVHTVQQVVSAPPSTKNPLFAGVMNNKDVIKLHAHATDDDQDF